MINIFKLLTQGVVIAAWCTMPAIAKAVNVYGSSPLCDMFQRPEIQTEIAISTSDYDIAICTNPYQTFSQYVIKDKTNNSYPVFLDVSGRQENNNPKSLTYTALWGSYTYRLYATCDDQARRGDVAIFTTLGPEGEGFYDETIDNYTSNSGWCQSRSTTQTESFPRNNLRPRRGTASETPVTPPTPAITPINKVPVGLTPINTNPPNLQILTYPERQRAWQNNYTCGLNLSYPTQDNSVLFTYDYLSKAYLSLNDRIEPLTLISHDFMGSSRKNYFGRFLFQMDNGLQSISLDLDRTPRYRDPAPGVAGIMWVINNRTGLYQTIPVVGTSGC